MSRIKRINKLKSRSEASKKAWRTRKKQLMARADKRVADIKSGKITKGPTLLAQMLPAFGKRSSNHGDN